MTDISKERQNEILEKALDWFAEHFESKELLDILHEHLDMNDSEIDFFGFDLPSVESTEQISLIHLHERDDDCYFYTNKPLSLFQAACIYQYNMSSNINRLTLDSFISEFGEADLINETAFSIMSKSISSSEKIANVMEFDFESNRFNIYDRGNCKWNSFHLCDIGEAIDEATFNDELSLSEQHSIFIKQLQGKEIIEPISSDESQIMSM
ncbi:MAG: hypothetical protein ACI37Z_04870 [Candidatus Gastranaerophilaceae bacterium]